MNKLITLAALMTVLICCCRAECGLNALSCTMELAAAVGADTKDTDKVCDAYNKMKTCLEEKGCKDVKEATKDITFDLSTCSAGMVQLSVITIVAALFAVFFTRH